MIKEEIFEGLYSLADGSYLRWNKMLKGWVKGSNIAFDILDQESDIVSYDIKYPQTLQRRISTKGRTFC